MKDEVFRARATTVQGPERERLWKEANKVWKYYDDYAKKTPREIPVVVLQRVDS